MRIDELIRAVNELHDSYHRLLLVVGPAGAGKSELLADACDRANWPLINLSLELARGLHQFRDRDRPRKVGQVAREILDGVEGDVACLDNVELIFEPVLRQDPLRLLEGLSRTRTIVAAWPGTYEGGRLVYAEPGHPEFRSYSEVQAGVVAL